jgi:uncharacterized membrane protein YgcG
VRIVRWSLATFAAVILLLIFAVPRKPLPPPSLAQPTQAFVDRVGIVSPKFASEWAGALLNDERAEIVVYVDRKPPEGDLAAWASQAATDWKIGAGKNHTGLAVFVFTEPRIARIDVGYGLESVFTDARARQLLEWHLAPAFAQRQYESGFDALITALRKEMGNDDAEAIHARAAEDRRSQRPWFSRIGEAFARTPRLVTAMTQSYLEGGAGTRFGVLVFVGVGFAIAAAGIAFAVNTAWRVATIPAKLRASRGREGRSMASLFENLKILEIVIGIPMFLVCLSLLMIVLLSAEGFLTRQGKFSGGGATIVWPAPR